MATQANPYVPPEEYLRLESETETRNEWHDGRVYAMAGASIQHAKIVTNLVTNLQPAAINCGCWVYASDVRLFVPDSKLFTYPDLMIVCGGVCLQPNAPDTVLNPTLIVEVLSPSTQDYDRGRKFVSYRAIKTLREYITVAQEKVAIEQFVLDGDRWILTDHTNSKQNITFTSACSISVRISEIYRDVFES